MADWSAWRGPSDNGSTSERFRPWKTGGSPKILWRAQLGESYASVAATATSVVGIGAGANFETTVCFDALTGKARWSRRNPHPARKSMADPHAVASGATPVISSGKVYTISREGLAECLDLRSGAVLWSRDLPREMKVEIPQFGFSGAAVRDGDRMLYTVGPGGLALDPDSGKTLWSSGPGSAGYASPVPYDDSNKRRCALFFSSDALRSADASTGEKLWEFPWKTQFNTYCVDPIVAGERMFITTFDDAKFLSLSGGKPKVELDAKVLRSTYGNPIKVGNFVYGIGRGQLQCVEWATGKERWSVRGAGDGALLVAGESVVLLTEKGELVIADARPEGYSERCRAKIMDGNCWSRPVLAGGRLYCRNNAGELICIDARG